MPAKGTTRLPRVACICNQCGKAFTIKGSQAARSRNHYCSRACNSASQSAKIERICAFCGETFLTVPSAVKKGFGRYCSAPCRDISAIREPNTRCAVCDKPFHVKPSKLAKDEGCYCSRACKNVGAVTKVERTCEICGTTFTAWPSLVTKGSAKYCSMDCRNKALSINLQGEKHHNWVGGEVDCICEVCGKVYRIPRVEVPTRHCCSQKCKGVRFSRLRQGENGPNWKGGRTLLLARVVTGEVLAWRRAVYARDDYTCQHCGSRGGELNAHHIKPWKDFPEHRFGVDNGLTLCVLCHRAEHKRMKALR